MDNKCDVCNEGFNKTYEWKCPTCGKEVKSIVQLKDIKSITPPTSEEIKTMNLEQLTEWRDKLYPFYDQRSEILKELGFEEWKKVIIWPTFYNKVQDLTKLNNSK